MSFNRPSPARRPVARGDAGPKKPKNIRNYVIWLLGKREWSEKEISDRLRQRGCSAEEISDALTYVRESGYQSDERYAISRAGMRARRYGNRRIAQELKSKGIDKETAEAAIADLGDEYERALAVVESFLGKPKDPSTRQKAYRRLASRHFSFDTINKVMRHLDEHWSR